MLETRLTRALLRLGAGATLAFIYLPLVVIGIYAFNENISQTWPIEHYTTKWFSVAWNDPDVRSALWPSVKSATPACKTRRRNTICYRARSVRVVRSPPKHS